MMKCTFLSASLILLVSSACLHVHAGSEGTTKKEQTRIEKWDVFEVELQGRKQGNPFKDVVLTAWFSNGDNQVEVRGFYDGDGLYRIRFMPDKPGRWRFQTGSNDPALDGHTGSFECVPPSGNNHGPVRVDHTYHFRYADGKFYNCIGTTSYAWIHQPEELAEQTLQTLADSPFNKIRMTVFPKSYKYNEFEEPDCYPFPCLKEGDSSWDGHFDSKGGKIEWEFDWTRFDTGFFRKLDARIRQLMELGVQADIILFHPYDRWGFANMGRNVDAFYLQYIVARISAFRNVWWSLSNEWDFVRKKTVEDWEVTGRTVAENDPYGHLLGIHNGREIFDHGKSWITHCSVQSHLPDIPGLREKYHKPVVIDEMGYEGNIYMGWGYLSALEMTHRFWDVLLRGGYPGHSEVYLNPQHIMWWNKGGEFEGQSVPRISFLKQILDRGPDTGIEPHSGKVSCSYCGWKTGEWIMGYTGRHQPAEVHVQLPPGKTYNLYYIDVWDMTITPAGDPVRVEDEVTVISLPGKPYTAFLFTCGMFDPINRE